MSAPGTTDYRPDARLLATRASLANVPVTDLDDDMLPGVLCYVRMRDESGEDVYRLAIVIGRGTIYASIKLVEDGRIIHQIRRRAISVLLQA